MGYQNYCYLVSKVAAFTIYHHHGSDLPISTNINKPRNRSQRSHNLFPHKLCKIVPAREKQHRSIVAWKNNQQLELVYREFQHRKELPHKKGRNTPRERERVIKGKKIIGIKTKATTTTTIIIIIKG